MTSAATRTGAMRIASLITFGTLTLHAATVFSVSGPNTAAGAQTEVLGDNNGYAVAFSTPTTYTNVNFFITLVDRFGEQPDPVLIDVFLTNHIGAGTTVANEIVHISPTITVPLSNVNAPFILTSVNVLSVPSLAAW